MTCELPCSPEALLKAGDDALAVLRPQHLVIDESKDGVFRGVIENSTFLGTHTRHEVRLDGGTTVRVHAPPMDQTAPSQPISLRILDGHGAIVPAGEVSLAPQSNLEEAR
jgi:ABC-type Fe3+/spermidine/putrescine transport system ATPase subunit